MKEIKKVLSLVMSVIMLITAMPAIHATELADLDIQQLKEMENKISTAVNKADNFNANGDGDEVVVEEENFPTLEELQNRYKEVQKMYEQLENEGTRKERRKARRHKEEVVNKAREYYELGDFLDEEEKDNIIYSTYLFDSMREKLAQGKKENKPAMTSKQKVYIETLIMAGVVGGFTGGFFIGDLALGYALKGCAIVGAISAVVSVAIFAIFYPKPMGKGDVIRKKGYSIKYTLTRNPYYAITDAYEVDGFAELYKNEESKKMLRDILDIEYYALSNPTVENLMYMIYPNTAYWIENMNDDDRTKYLSEVSQYFREGTTGGEMCEDPYKNLEEGNNN